MLEDIPPELGGSDGQTSSAVEGPNFLAQVVTGASDPLNSPAIETGDPLTTGGAGDPPNSPATETGDPLAADGIASRFGYAAAPIVQDGALPTVDSFSSEDRTASARVTGSMTRNTHSGGMSSMVSASSPSLLPSVPPSSPLSSSPSHSPTALSSGGRSSRREDVLRRFLFSFLMAHFVL